MIFVLIFIFILTGVFKTGFAGLPVSFVWETFILPEDYMTITAVYILFVHLVMSRTDVFFKENYFCRIRSRREYLFAEMFLTQMCVFVLWVTSLAAGGKYAALRFLFLFISCNLQVQLKLVFSKAISLIVMLSQLSLSMFADNHILFGDIAMECRVENIRNPVLIYIVIIIFLWMYLIKKINKMDVVSRDS